MSILGGDSKSSTSTVAPALSASGVGSPYEVVINLAYKASAKDLTFQLPDLPAVSQATALASQAIDSANQSAQSPAAQAFDNITNQLLWIGAVIFLLEFVL